MNIAIIGYGKMGKTIEAIAVQRGHQIVLKINSSNIEDFDAAHLENVDVAIEFTSPEAAFENVMKLIANKVPVVCGSTGWNEQKQIAIDACLAENVGFIWASNFSIGVNLFWEINKKMAQIMMPHNEYNLSIIETHHTQKKDAPSGTAITTAEQILNINPIWNSWKLGDDVQVGELPIIAHRIENVPGTHLVKYNSDIDEITLIHTAHSREGFALGAVVAAEYIKDKVGYFGMSDVLGLS